MSKVHLAKARPKAESLVGYIQMLLYYIVEPHPLL